jgi:ATP-dependent DNA helicase DinG
MLVIVKLPFQQPDPISEYERTLYPDFGAYFDAVIFPDMVIRLRQQFGRLLRTEKDTGCVAIIDCRISTNGRFRNRTLYALPDCPITNDITVLNNFLRFVKPLGYWE